MVGFIISIIVFVIAIIAGLFMWANENSKLAGFTTFGVFAFIAVVILIFSCMKSVPTGHTGVVTNFGRVEDTTLDAGMHFMKPWKKLTDNLH